MPVYRLSQNLKFPSASLAEPDGLLAVGGDLSPNRLLLAYKEGIFPWYSDQDPILWWSPDPRLVLYLEELHISRSLARTIRRRTYHVTIDTDFSSIIRSCALARGKNRESTWITGEMIDAYQNLFEMGYAHSFEVRFDGAIVGGLYGVSIGRSFFGESMFSTMSNASKVGLVFLRDFLIKNNFDFIDCQLPNEHLMRLGARQIEREAFLIQLRKSVIKPTLMGQWNLQTYLH